MNPCFNLGRRIHPDVGQLRVMIALCQEQNSLRTRVRLVLSKKEEKKVSRQRLDNNHNSKYDILTCINLGHERRWNCRDVNKTAENLTSIRVTETRKAKEGEICETLLRKMS